MSTHAVTGPAFPGGLSGLPELVTSAIREPTEIRWDASTSTATYVFTPDLTAAQAATFADCVAFRRSGLSTTLTLVEYQALAPFLATGRAFVQQSQSQYMALTQAQRDRMNFDNITALWRVIFRLLRD